MKPSDRNNNNNKTPGSTANNKNDYSKARLEVLEDELEEKNRRIEDLEREVENLRQDLLKEQGRLLRPSVLKPQINRLETSSNTSNTNNNNNNNTTNNNSKEKNNSNTKSRAQEKPNPTATPKEKKTKEQPQQPQRPTNNATKRKREEPAPKDKENIQEKAEEGQKEKKKQQKEENEKKHKSADPKILKEMERKMKELPITRDKEGSKYTKKPLKDFFKGEVFYFDEDNGDFKTSEVPELERIVIAYGGKVTTEYDYDEPTHTIMVTGLQTMVTFPDEEFVTEEWIRETHRRQAKVDRYELYKEAWDEEYGSD